MGVVDGDVEAGVKLVYAEPVDGLVVLCGDGVEKDIERGMP